MAFEMDHRVGILIVLAAAACGGGPDEPAVCWSWRANVARTALEPLAVLDGAHALIVNGGLLRLGPSGWTVEHAASEIFALQRGAGWTAVAVRGAPGQSDWFELQRDGEGWRRVDAPASLLENRWESVASDDDALYVRDTTGVIARFDGERWEQLPTAVASNRAVIAVAGDALYDWHDGALHVFEEGVWRQIADSSGPAIAGDAQHVYVQQESFVLARHTPQGFEPLPAAPGPIEAVRARGAQVAIRVRRENAGIYRLVDGAWQLASQEPGLLALDDDGTLLVSDGSGALRVAPDGAAEPLGSAIEPVAPLAGDSLERLFAPGAHGGLLRLAGDRWEVVAGTAALQITALWQAPDSTLFLATDSAVYHLGDDGLQPLGAPDPGRVLGLVGRSAAEVYATTVDAAGASLRMHRWDGAAWRPLDALTLALGTRTPYAPRLFGARGVLLVLSGVSAPDDDPVGYWDVLASTGEGWTEVSGYNEFDADDITAVQMGTAASPGAMLLIDTGDEVRYEILGEGDGPQTPRRGTFELPLRGGVAGLDLDRMAGVVRTGGVARFAVRSGGGWRQIGAGEITSGLSYPSAGWYGLDAVGVASQSGVSLCTR
jgi:hypothetical protein